MLYHDDRIAPFHQFVDNLQQLTHVFEMQPRRGFVKDIKGTARIAFGQFARQLDTLALAARQRGTRLSQLEIAESHLLNRTQFRIDTGDMLKKFDGHVHGHVEHVVDAFPLVFHFERLPVVTFPAARLARHVNIRQEVHFNRLYSSSLALFAASPLHIEGETSRLETACLRIGSGLEEFAYITENIGVGGRIAPRGTSYRGLVHDDQLVDMLQPLDGVVFERLVERTVEPTADGRTQRIVHDGGLAAATDTRHAYQFAERELDRNVFQVVAPRPSQYDTVPVACASSGGHFDAAFTVQVPGGDAVGLHNLLRSTLRHDIAAFPPGKRPDVDDMVGTAYHLLVVLHYDDRIAGVPELLKASDEFAVVTLMEPDARLVQNIENVHQLGTYLCGEPDTLALAAR